LAVALAVYLSAGISGAHLNPAVTIALALFAGFDKRKVPFYIIAQVSGAALGALLVYGLYSNLFMDYEQTHHMVRGSVESLELAGIFSTYHIIYFLLDRRLWWKCLSLCYSLAHHGDWG